MGKKSVKENKTIYQICRENAGYTREKASELLDFISADRIEKIENEKTRPRPEEILAMAEVYKAKNLRNYFCTHECEIGERYVPVITHKQLSQIVLEMLSSLNTMDKQKDRLIEITADGIIENDELEDFVDIQAKLHNISVSVESLQLWVEQTLANGQIDREKLEAYQREKGLIS